MNRALIFLTLAFFSCAVTDVAAQVQTQRGRPDRTEQTLIRSARDHERDREHDRQLEEAGRLPVPKPAVLNVDVQMVLSKTEHKTFAAAKAAEVKKVVDGDPLWLHVKFKTKLGDYVLTTRSPEDQEKLRYTLYVEIAPRGDITALTQYAIQFSKEDLALTEVKINLAPGIFGRNKSIPMFLMASGAGRTGVWNNELRLANTLVVPRALTDNLATAPVTLDFSGGTAKYKKMDSEYESIVLRGTKDTTRLPVAGTFFSDALTARIAEKLGSENIKPLKVYFASEDWQEVTTFGPQMKKTRKVVAVFTYRRGETCHYGIAHAIENYDFMQAKFSDAEINLQKDLSVPCTEI